MSFIKNHIDRLHIRSKLLFGYAMVFFLFLFVGVLFLEPILRRTIETNIESEMNNTTKTILSMVKASADASIKNYLRAVAEKNRDVIQDLYRQYRRGELQEAEAKRRAGSVLLSQRIGETGYIYCLDSKGIIRVHPVVALLGADLTPYGFIQDQLKLKEGYIEYDWKNPGEREEKPKALYMTYFQPWDWILSASSYREEFTQLINIGFFRDSILSIHFGKTGYPYIIDSRANIVVHPVFSGNLYDIQASEDKNFIREICEKKNGKIEYSWRNPDEKDYRVKLALFRYIPEFDWIVVSSSYREEFYEPLTLMRWVLVTTFFVSLFLLSLLMLFYSSYIVNNLNRLIHGFQKGSSGNFQIRLPRISGDEFGRLTDYFNEFMGKLETYKQERDQAEETLRNSERKLAEIFNFLPDPTFVIDLEGKIILWNRAAEEYTGVKAGDLIGKSNYEHAKAIYGSRRPILIDLVLHPCEEMEKLYFSLKREGGRISGEAYTQHADGKQVYILGTAARMYDSKGNGIGAIESIRNLSERKHYEDALQKSEEKYRSLVDNLNVGVCRTTREPHGSFLQVNPAMIKMFGFASAEEMLAVEVSSLYQRPEERVLFAEEVRRLGSVKDIELAMQKKDGTSIWTSVSSQAQCDEKGELKWIDTVLEDITERKKLEEQLRRSQKLEAIGTLAGGVAHDFNNILTAIIGYSNLLKLQIEENSSLADNVNEILSAAQRAAHLTHSLLAFSRKQVISLKPVDINEIIRQINKLLVRIIGEDIELQTILSSQELVIMADSGQMEQILVNLATNARDAMPEGGRITIRSERMVKTDSHDGLKPGSYAVVSLSDTGRGMDEATRQRIFEPFYTTKEMGKGTGLGLSIVYGIVKQHNGEIYVCSEPGKGTTFQIYLELVATKADGTENAPADPLIGGSATILVAEDDATIRKLLREILEMYGYTVIEAVDGEDAVRRFQENKDRIQLLIIDVIMPKKNGKEAYEEIKKIHGDVRVLFSSGYTADIIHKKGVLEEGVNFLSKPATPQHLLSKVREVLNS